MVLRHAYGFDDVAIAPGEITINPDLVDTTFDLAGTKFRIPFIASSMDAIVSPKFTSSLHEQGGLAVLNLNGLFCKYDETEQIFEDISKLSKDESTEFMQKIYNEPIKENLIRKRIQEIKSLGSKCAVATLPASTKKLLSLIQEEGADLLFVQSTVTTARHRSHSLKGLIFSEIKKMLEIPLVVGNTVSYSVTRELMEQGVDGILVGVGPGHACTSRETIGIGIPQISATMDCAKARDEYFKSTGKYVSIITDGGIRTGGDVCKSMASGADAVMIGTPFARTSEAPGLGFNWGMATPDSNLPRGTRIKVGVETDLKTLLYGPSSRTDGTFNLVGALRNCMGMIGADTLRDMHAAQMVYAPAIKTEGKIFQLNSE